MSCSVFLASLRRVPLLSSLLISAAFADPSVPVRVINTPANPVPVTGTVNVGTLPPVTGTVGISGTPSVNIASMPPVNVTTSREPDYFVVPYALNVTATDHIGASLARPAILDSIATNCNGSLVGTHFQVTTDFMTRSASAFDPPPAGTQLLVRSATTGDYSPAAMALNYPPYAYQHLLDYPSLTTAEFSVTQLNLLVLSDVEILGPAFNPGLTYCWGYFLFRKL